MKFTDETSDWLSVLQKLVENPKTTAAASASVATAGVATAGQWVTTGAGLLAVLVGVVATAFLARVHWFKGEQYRLEAEHQRLENEIMKQKARSLGIPVEENAT